MNRRILGLALPNIITNITVPLLGMVDTAIMGHLSKEGLGAIAIGASLFNLIYWNFGFLRMGTSGITAQAYGARRWDEAVKTLIRACTIALCIALTLIALQWPIGLLVPVFFEGSDKVLSMALTYFQVRIWAAPATLGLYAIKGWFIGMQDSKTPMWIAIALNIVNIIFSLLFVMVFHWDIAGVALGTVVAQYSGLAMGIVFLRKKLREESGKWKVECPQLSTFHFPLSTLSSVLRWEDMRRFFKVNGDIFLRTVCLSAVFTFITAAGSHISDEVLAVNNLLMQFFTLFSYIMDGFAYAGESLVGRYIGAREPKNLRSAVRLLILWGLVLTVVFTGAYALGGEWFLRIFTDQQAVIDAAGDYLFWVLIVPVCGFAAFLFDGIFIGATASRTMRNAMFVATAAFFAVYYGLKAAYAPLDTHTWNNILWTAFMVFLTLRGLLQWLRLKKDVYGLIILALLTFTFVPTHAQTGWTDAFARPKVAVVLSGGGAKGVAHISALRAIEDAGLPIDIITGTSMGSLIGGLYAIGWSTDELDSLVRSQDWTFLLTDRVNPESVDIDTRRIQNTYALWHAFTPGNANRNSGAGFIRGTNLDHLFDRLLEGYLDSIDFNTLPIPFACVATDVITNTEVDFHSGYLKQAMRASMSIPGVFSPVRMGDLLLVDGGLRNNYPADIARQMGADIIIGVTVQGDTLAADDVTGPIDLLMQVIDINCKNKYNDNIAMSDIVMHVDVSGYSAASFTADAIDTLLRRGAEEAARHRDALVALRNDIATKRPRWNTQRTVSPTSVDQAENKHSYKLTAPPTPLLYNPIVGVAFRFDNEETGALQIGARFPFKWGIPMEVNGHLRLGKRIQFHAEQFLYPRGVTSPSLSYTYFRNDIDIYSDGIRSYNSKYNQHRLSLMPINSRFRNYKLRAGIIFDYYDFFDPILSAGGSTIVVDDSRFFSYHFESTLYTENDYYTPTRGIFFIASYTYRTDNLLTYMDNAGISEVRTIWRNSFALSSAFTLSPCLFGRLVIAQDDVPYPFANALGSYQNIVDQQLAFPGVHSLTFVDPLFVAAQLRLQFNFHKNQYLIFRAAAARKSRDFEELLRIEPNIYGFAIGYCYNSFLGPISADLGYSTLAPGLNFYLNIGHYF